MFQCSREEVTEQLSASMQRPASQSVSTVDREKVLLVLYRYVNATDRLVLQVGLFYSLVSAIGRLVLQSGLNYW